MASRKLDLSLPPLALDQIEVTLAHDTVIFERAVFLDSDAATEYAVAKARAYHADVTPRPRRDPS